MIDLGFSLVIRGYRQTLQSNDIYDIMPDDSSARIEPRFQAKWQQYSHLTYQFVLYN